MRGINYNHAGMYNDAYAKHTRVRSFHCADHATAAGPITLGEFVRQELRTTDGTDAYRQWLSARRAMGSRQATHT